MQSYTARKKLLLNNLQNTEGEVYLKKKTSNLFRYQKKKSGLDVRGFNHVLNIDTETQSAEIEGMATYEDIVDATLKLGHMPTVIPELKSITVGGAITGTGLEMTSFKYGWVHETILEMDVLTPKGKIVTCSKTKNSDLFLAMPNSYGTLGYVLKCKISIIPVKPYVRINRKKYNNAKQYFSDIKKASLESRKNNLFDFIEGTIFSENEMYTSFGKMVDSAPNTSDYTYLKIYYLSLQNKALDYMEIKDYIWRWDTDWFWCSKYFGMESKILRLIFGRRFLTSKVYHKIMNLNRKFPVLAMVTKLIGKRSETLVQDVEIPVDKAHIFMAWFHKKIGMRPLSICPNMNYDGKTKWTLFPLDPNTLYINIGFYGQVPSDKALGHYDRLIEEETKSMHTLKMLYSTAYYSEEEFWNIYDKGSYDTLKTKYDPNSRFKNLYEKVIVQN